MNLLETTNHIMLSSIHYIGANASFANSGFGNLLVVSAIGSIVFLVAIGLHSLLKNRLSARWIYFLWIIVIVRFALFAVPESPTSFLNFVDTPAVNSSEVVFADSPVSFDNELLIEEANIHSSPREFDGHTAIDTAWSEPGSENFQFDRWFCLKAIWIAGFSWMVAVLLFQFVRVRSLIRNSCKANATLQNEFKLVKQKMGFCRRVSLAITNDLDVPAMAGLFRPVVLLPQWCISELTKQELEMVMTHELVHVRRHDGLIQLLAYLIKSIHWFNPLVRVADRIAADYRELSCDSEVVSLLSKNNRRKTMQKYGRMIIKIAERTNVTQNPPVLVGQFLGKDKHLIKQRIAMLTESKTKSKFASALAVACVTFVVAVGFTSAQTAQVSTPQEPSVEETTSEYSPQLPVDNETKTALEAGQAKTKKAKLASENHVIHQHPAWKSIGITIAPSTPMTAIENLSFAIRVMKVDDGSLAEKQGILVDDILCAVDGWKTKSLDNVAVAFDRKIIAQPNSKGITDLRFYIQRNTGDGWQPVEFDSVPLSIEPTVEPSTVEPSTIEVVAAMPEIHEPAGIIKICAGSARKLTFGFQIPEIMIENPDVVNVSATSPTTLLATGLKCGKTTITISNGDGELEEFSVLVEPDVRKLNRAFRNHFPDCEIKVEALSEKTVTLKGTVLRAEQMKNVLAVARDYDPELVIVNQLEVAGSNQHVAVKVKVYEVSNKRLRQLGIDWSFLGAKKVESISELACLLSGDLGKSEEQAIHVGVVENTKKAMAFIEALERNAVAKLLDQPVLVGIPGRPAEFLSGSEVPIRKEPEGNIEFRLDGTKIEMVPILTAGKKITLELRVEVSKADEKLGAQTGVPGFRVRRVNAGVCVDEGQAIVVAGGFPGSTEEHESELFFIMTPRFVEMQAVDPKPKTTFR